MSETLKPPFDETMIGEQIGQGGESRVTRLEPGYVLKEPRLEERIKEYGEEYEPQNEQEEMAMQRLIAYSRSDEYFWTHKEDHIAMRKIFGDMLLETTYVKGHPREGNPTGHYKIQKEVSGKTWREFSKEKDKASRDKFVETHKEEFITLIGGAKKTLIELGGTVDLWSENVMVLEENGEEKLLIVDPGSPSALRYLMETDMLSGIPEGIKQNLKENTTRVIDVLDKAVENANLSEDDVENMYKRFDFTKEDYEQAKKSLMEDLHKCLDIGTPE